MKNLDEIAVIVQARLNSQRVPQKMIKPFADSNLFAIILDKLLQSKIIPKHNIYGSVYEQELIDELDKRELNYWHRSEASANEDEDLRLIYEWHNKLFAKYKYVILISGCNPLLKIETIDKFVEKFVTQTEDNLFAVFEKKTYYWDKDGKMITYWPSDRKIMNTKAVDPIYEAGHCMYASSLDIIDTERFMVDFTKDKLNLFLMDELEAFDIDYQWQFEVGELLYEKFIK
jgi:CMP-N-acetylneuraminic acid synthetase